MSRVELFERIRRDHRDLGLGIPVPFNPRVIPYATRYWFADSSKATRELRVTFRSARDALRRAPGPVQPFPK